MSELTLFKGGVPAYLKELQDETTDSLSGGELGQRRISIKGGVFREMIGAKEYRVSEDRAMNVIIIKASPKNHRTYFAGTYVEGQAAQPTCWSTDEVAPAPEVPEDQRQASRCMDCPQNVKGSGQGDSRACRYSRRIAVMLEGEVDKREVYQVILPATSVFGDGEKGKLPLQAYARHLKAHGVPIAGVITEMRFDTSVPTPKLVFKPLRQISEDEFAVVREMRDSVEAEDAIKMKVAPPRAERAAPAPKAIKAAAPVAVEAEEDEPAPKKVVKKADQPPKGNSLDALVAGWDDE